MSFVAHKLYMSFVLKEATRVAHLYHRSLVCVDDKHVTIRPIDEEDYHVAVTFNDDADADNVTELLLSRTEVQTAYDLLFNR